MHFIFTHMSLQIYVLIVQTSAIEILLLENDAVNAYIQHKGDILRMTINSAYSVLIQVYMYIYLRIYTYMYVHVYALIYICVYEFIYIYMYVCEYVHIYENVDICMCIDTCIRKIF
jgi:hypothetical protein